MGVGRGATGRRVRSTRARTVAGGRRRPCHTAQLAATPRPPAFRPRTTHGSVNPPNLQPPTARRLRCRGAGGSVWRLPTSSPPARARPSCAPWACAGATWWRCGRGWRCWVGWAGGQQGRPGGSRGRAWPTPSPPAPHPPTPCPCLHPALQPGSATRALLAPLSTRLSLARWWGGRRAAEGRRSAGTHCCGFAETRTRQCFRPPAARLG